MPGNSLMINTEQLIEHIIRPSLEAIDACSEPAVALLQAVAMAESGGGYYVKQFGKGPALGIYQMEPDTYKDIWFNFLAGRPDLRSKVLVAIGTHIQPTAERLITDMMLATIMARLHFMRRSEPLPATHDLKGQARYWKLYYNTEYGAGTVKGFIEKNGGVAE